MRRPLCRGGEGISSNGCAKWLDRAMLDHNFQSLDAGLRRTRVEPLDNPGGENARRSFVLRSSPRTAGGIVEMSGARRDASQKLPRSSACLDSLVYVSDLCNV